MWQHTGATQESLAWQLRSCSVALSEESTPGLPHRLLAFQSGMCFFTHFNVNCFRKRWIIRIMEIYLEIVNYKCKRSETAEQNDTWIVYVAYSMNSLQEEIIPMLLCSNQSNKCSFWFSRWRCCFQVALGHSSTFPLWLMRWFPGQPRSDNKTTLGEVQQQQHKMPVDKHTQPVMSEVCVRVAVRIRPLLPKEVLHQHQVCVRAVPGFEQVMLGSDRCFAFDHAFGPTVGQDQVYESCVQPLVESLVDGYNATVFCYGQTGSGKTYTLGGGNQGEFHNQVFMQKGRFRGIVKGTVNRIWKCMIEVGHVYCMWIA